MELEQASLNDIQKEIQRRILELQSFLPGIPYNNENTQAPARLGKNLRESVLFAVQDRPYGTPGISRSQLHKQIRGYDVKSIGATLALLCRQKAIKRVSRGIYTAR